ncbi:MULTISPECIES: adenylate kinase [unclassified Curtobacterium]|uniref:adenylate kinase n=1 Tax=unclassified Curtobacterium TaxID=257496 RepID=UPI00089DE4FA|nr:MULTISPECIES: adenylate kinase [unclassified Curtobacterium]AOX65960.1 adenylate kinase [Curtobacterium sp. BH-2-1-1]MCT9621257.1 adenylate kinase [Curtobacterium sp. C2H10]MDR6169443.1 adenylate kinase [Curtobacterium sp. SORGH_AS_0776]MDR6572189.1 adenylate kinase [Curtobacterium sp. 320]OII23453.1 adenylate kinase [Curtobacterium sp. MCBA15_016]
MSARLIIVGPPGAGKGTQAGRIADAFGIPAVSTGDIFRKNVAEGTPLGVQAKAIMDAGDYVPDSLTNELVKSRLHEADAENGFLLDGYPRTVGQVEYLDALLAEQGTGIDAVVQLVADQDELVGRLLKRAEEQGRSDDNEETIRRRQQVYTEQTAPIVAAYGERGLVVDVDGLGGIDEVGDRIQAALSSRGLTAGV